ncbi:MAG: ABC-F family ATP-binding cassette domain-containing protein [Tannerella sp.]|jgi:ATP-binding cassette subfamily F protein uup|nr:ABC-F family ATP-binding cassette domain-containing protein [Tannerella sp.]
MVSLLQIDHLTKRFGDLVLYENISFGVAQGQKTGLIARNGAGKTTLLNIISGKESADEGDVVFRNDLRVGYLEQSPAYPEGLTVLQACFYSQSELVLLIADYEAALLSNDTKALETLIPRMEQEKAWDYERKAKQILTQLKIKDFDRKVETLSGGQLKRVALANVLIPEPELVLLDEPTNHLDLETIEWLEGYLKRSNISLLMITHDRYFLDEVCNEIIEIDNKQLYSCKGNYSYFLDKRAERMEAAQAAIDHANNLLRKELDWMRRQPQARATKAKYRINAFYELEKKAGQRQEEGNVNLNVKASYIGSKIFEAGHVCKSFGNVRILNDFNYVFSRYEKLGIVGDNGVGKSTFIKLLMGEIPPDSGGFTIGETVRFGYYSQDGLPFDEKMKVIDVVQDIAEYITLGNGKSLSVSQFLNYFLFTPEKQHHFVHKLSGGEKRRLYLCTILMSNPNFLVLDEPTNDLDIVTLNVLEDYLANFKGCVIVISHDRYFMDKVVDHLFVFHGHADIRDFPGNYTQYRLWKTQQERSGGKQGNPSSGGAPGQPAATGGKPAYRPPFGKKKLSYKEQKELEALEEEIPTLEDKKSAIEEALNSGTLSIEELNRQSARIGELMEEIDEKTMRWLELSE